MLKVPVQKIYCVFNDANTFHANELLGEIFLVAV